MNSEIKTVSDLRMEIERLTLLKDQKEIDIQTGFRNLTEELSPVNLAKSAFNSIINKKDIQNSIGSMGAEAAIGFIVSNFLFKKSNPLFRTIAVIASTTLAGTVLGDNTEKIIGKFKNLLARYRNINKKKTDLFDEKDIYKG